MKKEIVLCDYCNTQADMDFYSEKGWIVLDKVCAQELYFYFEVKLGRDKNNNAKCTSEKVNIPLHFCSIECFNKYFKNIFLKCKIKVEEKK